MNRLVEKQKEVPMPRYKPDHSEVEKLCKEYQVGELLTIDGELGGLFNVNLKITTSSGQYVLRIHSGLSLEEHLHAEKILLKKLRGNGVPALTPLDTKEGCYYTKLHNRIVQLTPFVESAPFRFSSEQVYQCGQVLRNFHDVLKIEKAIPVPLWSNYPSESVLKEGMEIFTDQQQKIHDDFLIKEAKKLYQSVMAQWLPKEASLPKVVIHGDWHPWNLLFNEGNEINNILDFDFLQRGERIHDIAYFLWAIRKTEGYEESAKHFLKGYGSLTGIEVEMLPVAMARASLFFICTASFVSNPVLELQVQLKDQKPFIEWVLSQEGKACVRRWPMLR
ncbi:hypothetical protein D3H55_14380 [Bacillus salacetis]|uniref:Aminoglycoside phosphotransferase domain-containing protein n=1 Tax=Bacillus salacetis TaxID=2315464 RepID=A0A3A1QVM6_9BACI|nr:phosphotransferase [Bacillus salacetis]RIW32054.1 hypothetical protein D3H55_14380 [Bacillus salacetis]